MLGEDRCGLGCAGLFLSLGTHSCSIPLLDHHKWLLGTSLHVAQARVNVSACWRRCVHVVRKFRNMHVKCPSALKAFTAFETFKPFKTFKTFKAINATKQNQTANPLNAMAFSGVQNEYY